MVSNIKSVTTPSHNGNTTHIMMLTEEKFKNLKSEISQQQEHQAVSNFIVPQVNLHHSSQIHDFTNTTQTPRNDGQSNRPSNTNIQNLSSFIMHQKYFQVYENYRRGFQLINELKEKSKLYAFSKIKLYSTDNKLREEKLKQFIKLLSHVVKNNVLNIKYHGFKRIKKVYKERQLSVYIKQKQNQFAKQTSALLKVDQIIMNTLHQNMQQSFKAILEYYQQIQLIKQEKRQKGIINLQSILARKNKQILEKSIRYILSWTNEKRILEMNFKIMQRVFTKIQQRQKKTAFNQVKQYSIIKYKLIKILSTINHTNIQRSFNAFLLKVQLLSKMDTVYQNHLSLLCINFEKQQMRNHLSIWKNKISVAKRAIIALEMMSHIHEQQQKYTYFKKYKLTVEDQLMRIKYLKSMKPSLLLLFKKFDELKKNSCRVAFQALIANLFYQEDTMLINKSGAQTNLSFTLQQPVEMSLILNKRNNNTNNVQNKAIYRESGSHTSRNHYRTQQQPAKSVGKQYAQAIQRATQQTNIYQNQTQILDKSSSKKPTLNDYLSFTPGSGSNQKQGNLNNTKFFNHKRNDAGCSSARNQTKNKMVNDFIKTEKQYLDCPIPLKDYQDKQNKKASMKFQKEENDPSQHQQSYENLNQLNVSIKDMNQAFRDQISRIKEKQQEEIDKSYMSSVNNMFGQDQSFDNQMNQLQIELTQTPDQLQEENDDNYKKKLVFDHPSKNISPKINPLCTSESYQLFRGTGQNPYTMQQYSVEQKGNIQNYKPISSVSVAQYSQNNINQKYYNNQGDMIILSDKINDHQLELNALPQTSTFGELRLLSQHSNDEDVEGSNEQKFESINRTKNPSSHKNETIQRLPSDPGSNFAYGSNITKKKSDQRYQMNSVLEHDYSLEIQQQHDMFDEIAKQEQDAQYQQQVHRVQSANNLSDIYTKNSIANHSKRQDQTQSQNQQNDLSQDFIDMQKNLMQKRTFDLRQNQQQTTTPAIQHAFQMYQDQNKKKDDINNQTKILHISPKFDESFVPSQLNRDLLNEMAANYQMLELTPDGDYNMLLHNKSIFKREESVYSNNQYADPMEMALSPRGQNIPDVSAINHQNLTTNQSQLNCYGMVFDVNKDSNQDEENDYEQEYQEQVSELIDYGRESRPYDFELSSNSKYKIISENNLAKQVLTTESAQPSIMMPQNNVSNTSNICKKLSFGYDLAKKNNQAKNKQKSTLIVSGGEQTINFNLTQEDDSSFQMVDYDDKFYQQKQQNQQNIKEQEDEDDEELDVGEEIPTEQIQNIQKVLPESKILQQELQEEKFNMTLTHTDLMQITQNRLQKMQSNNQSYAQTHREMVGHQRSQQNGQDFIQNNIQKLRNMIKASPRYQGIETNQSDDYNTRMNSANNSTRNATSQNKMNFGQMNSLPQQSYDLSQQQQQQQQFQTQASRQSNTSINLLPNIESQPQVYRSFAFNQITNLSQNNPLRQQQLQQSQQQQSQSIVSTKTTSNTRKPKTQYLMPSTARNPSKENRGSTNFTGGFVNVLGERKQSINTSQAFHQQQQQQQQQLPVNIRSYNSQNVLREQSQTNNQRKSSSGSGYQPLTFRAPTQHLSNTSVQQLQQQQQYNSFGGIVQNAHNVNSSYQSNSLNRMQNNHGVAVVGSGVNSKNSSKSSNNISKILNGSGNVSLNAYNNNNNNNNIMQERRISHQDISVNLSGGQGITNMSGFGTHSQKSSQQSLTGRSRNNQADKVQSLLSQGSKVIQQNISQIYRNSQNSSANNSQNFNNYRSSHSNNRGNY